MLPRVGVLVVSALCAVALAGGGPAPAQSESVASVETTVYFLTSDRSAPIGVRRSIPSESPYALEALRALLAGPTSAEARQGLTSALPPGVGIRSLRTPGSTDVVVDLSGLPNIEDGVERVRIITQVVRSLVGLSGIQKVWFRADGEPWGLWRMAGGVDDGPYGYDNLLGFWVCSAKPGTEDVPGDCFSALP